MEYLREILLTLSSALLVPDLVAALVLLGLALAEVGFLAAALVVRARSSPLLVDLLSALRGGDAAARRQALEHHLAMDPVPSGIPFRLAALGSAAWRAPVRQLATEEAALASERRIARLVLCVRLGPIVGLVGTLIPLGPGLVALATGDVATMASHLTVAFTVTVVGLVTGALGFLLASARRTVDSRDLAKLEFIAASLDELDAGEQP